MGRKAGVRKAAAAKIDEDSSLDVELLQREDEIRAEGATAEFIHACASFSMSVDGRDVLLGQLNCPEPERRLPAPPANLAVKKRSADIKLTLKKVQDELDAVIAAQLETIPKEVRPVATHL